jgi:hypothetical protein
LVYFAAERGQAGAVQDPSRCIPDLFHGQMHPTNGFIAAVGAALVGGLAGTGNRGQGPIEHPDDLTQVDIGRVSGEEIPSTLSFSAPQQTLVLEAKQDQLEELGRNLLGAREIGDAHRLLRIGIRERKESLDGVFRLLGEHYVRIIYPFSTGTFSSAVLRQLLHPGGAAGQARNQSSDCLGKLNAPPTGVQEQEEQQQENDMGEERVSPGQEQS